MRHPSNRGERKLARDKFRRRAAEDEIYDNGHKERRVGPDFNPADRDRKAVKRHEKNWQVVAKLLPSGAKELSPTDLFFGGKVAGGEDYLRF